MRTRITLAALFALVWPLMEACTAKCPAGRRLSQGKCVAPLESGSTLAEAGVDADGAAQDGGSDVDAAKSNITGKRDSGTASAGGAGSGRAEAGAGSAGAAGAAAGSSGSSGGVSLPGQCVPVDELCDGQDNDCDGKTDEAVTRACGPTPQGACMSGTEECVAGAWSGTCVGAVESGAEVCDPEGVDENCDGASNEGCACAAGATQTCGTDTGVCVPGTQTCDELGQWAQDCVGAVGPQTEVCDGQADEDCDNKVDEGCDCTNGATRMCGQMRGECRPGMSTCSEGKWSTTCAGEKGPAADGCDGRDNDCDGSTDENVLNACGGCDRLTNAPGAACSAGRNACRADGEYECQGMNATRCNATARASSTEVCNGQDDDCDGVNDNGVAPNICGGSCLDEIDGQVGAACEIPATGGCFSIGKRTCNAARTELRCAPCVYNCQLADESTIQTTTPCDYASSGTVCAPADPTCRTDTTTP
jgi:hypothetical protein